MVVNIELYNKTTWQANVANWHILEQQDSSADVRDPNIFKQQDIWSMVVNDTYLSKNRIQLMSWTDI